MKHHPSKMTIEAENSTPVAQLQHLLEATGGKKMDPKIRGFFRRWLVVKVRYWKDFIKN